MNTMPQDTEALEFWRKMLRFYNTRITDLELTTPLYNAIRRSFVGHNRDGYKSEYLTVSDLLKFTPAEIGNFYNIGPTGYANICTALRKLEAEILDSSMNSIIRHYEATVEFDLNRTLK